MAPPEKIDKPKDREPDTSAATQLNELRSLLRKAGNDPRRLEGRSLYNAPDGPAKALETLVKMLDIKDSNSRDALARHLTDRLTLALSVRGINLDAANEWEIEKGTLVFYKRQEEDGSKNIIFEIVLFPGETKIERKEYPRAYYELGEYKHSKEKKEFPDAHVLIGSVDGTRHDKDKKREDWWYLEKAQDAKRLLEMKAQNRLEASALTYVHKAEKELIALAAFADTGKTSIGSIQENFESKFKTDKIFGVYGVYNLVLAFQRACQGVEPSENLTFDLRVSREKHSAKNRYGTALVRSEVAIHEGGGERDSGRSEYSWGEGPKREPTVTKIRKSRRDDAITIPGATAQSGGGQKISRENTLTIPPEPDTPPNQSNAIKVDPDASQQKTTAEKGLSSDKEKAKEMKEKPKTGKEKIIAALKNEEIFRDFLQLEDGNNGYIYMRTAFFTTIENTLQFKVTDKSIIIYKTASLSKEKPKKIQTITGETPENTAQKAAAFLLDIAQKEPKRPNGFKTAEYDYRGIWITPDNKTYDIYGTPFVGLTQKEKKGEGKKSEHIFNVVSSDFTWFNGNNKYDLRTQLTTEAYTRKNAEFKKIYEDYASRYGLQPLPEEQQEKNEFVRKYTYKDMTITFSMNNSDNYGSFYTIFAESANKDRLFPRAFKEDEIVTELDEFIKYLGAGAAPRPNTPAAEPASESAPTAVPPSAVPALAAEPVPPPATPLEVPTTADTKEVVDDIVEPGTEIIGTVNYSKAITAVLNKKKINVPESSPSKFTYTENKDGTYTLIFNDENNPPLLDLTVPKNIINGSKTEIRAVILKILASNEEFRRQSRFNKVTIDKYFKGKKYKIVHKDNAIPVSMLNAKGKYFEIERIPRFDSEGMYYSAYEKEPGSERGDIQNKIIQPKLFDSNFNSLLNQVDARINGNVEIEVAPPPLEEIPIPPAVSPTVPDIPAPPASPGTPIIPAPSIPTPPGGSLEKSTKPTGQKTAQKQIKKGKKEKIPHVPPPEVLPHFKTIDEALTYKPEWKIWTENACIKNGLDPEKFMPIIYVILWIETTMDPYKGWGRMKGTMGFAQAMEYARNAYWKENRDFWAKKRGDQNLPDLAGMQKNPSPIFCDPEIGIDVVAWYIKDNMNALGLKAKNPNFMMKLYLAHNSGGGGMVDILRYVGNPTGENYEAMPWFAREQVKRRNPATRKEEKVFKTADSTLLREWEKASLKLDGSPFLEWEERYVLAKGAEASLANYNRKHKKDAKKGAPVTTGKIARSDTSGSSGSID